MLSRTSGQGMGKEYLSRGWIASNDDSDSVVLKEEFIEKVVRERARLLLISAMVRLHVLGTVQGLPHGRCGFVVLFIKALLSQCMTRLYQFIILEKLKEELIGLDDM